MSHSRPTWSATHPPERSAYRVLLWESGRLSDELLRHWQQERNMLLQQMQDAGVKGARGQLRSIEQRLAALNAELIEAPLSLSSSEQSLRARVSEHAYRLRDAAQLLGYELIGDALILLLELTDERPLPELLQESLALLEPAIHINWCTSPLIQALSAEDCYRIQQDLNDELNKEKVKGDEQLNTWQQLAEDFHHLTVLAEEASSALQASAGKTLVDATLGGGGHSARLLAAGAHVIGIDQDPVARCAARTRLTEYGEQLQIVSGNFRELSELLASEGISEVDGLLADIGISSPQVDCAQRGFSFLHDGPLDMRMNPESPYSAADLIAQESEQALADILWQYGEERASRAIARRIVRERGITPITSTSQLASIIASVLPRKGKQHPATRSFQALRIAVNDELGALHALLEQGIKLLRPQGRMAIITFHSLEDRAVKRFFERVTRPEIDRPEWPAPRPNPEYCARLITRKPIIASEQELSLNPRARSAKLRVIEKLASPSASAPHILPPRHVK